MSSDTIINIVVRAQAGDTEAFGQLFEHFQSRVFGIAMQRLRNTAEADELT